MDRKCQLIVSLDVEKKKDFVDLIDATKEVADIYKVGLVPYTALGDQAVTILKKKKKKVFLDLKFLDIPNTMVKASLNMMSRGIDMLDFHLSAEEEALSLTLDKIRAQARKQKFQLPLFLGVTVLTSVAAKSKITNFVLSLSEKAVSAGFNGVVLSGQEAPYIRRKIGSGFILVCPGIRLKDSADDQKRVVTPAKIKNIADYIVVGRPVYNAKSPKEIAEKIIRELETR